MTRWKLYSSEEVQRMGEVNRDKPKTDVTERFCSGCGESKGRFYYHETNLGRRIGSSWFWCPNCKKCSHFTGPPLSVKFVYNDPYGELSPEEFGKLEKTNWYDHLNDLWNRGILPQRFYTKD